MKVMSLEPAPILHARQAAADLSAPPSPADADVRPKPMISLVLPAYNESAVLQPNLSVLCDYMKSLEPKYAWEMIIINDGSKDDTAEQARQFASTRQNVLVINHPTNFGLGQALRSGFNHARGDYVVTMDMDLSYTPDHIERLVEKMRQTTAKVVIASPYFAGGAVENVPGLRKWLSVGANQFLSLAAHGKIKTLTGMVRAYDAQFLRSLDFYSMGMEVNSEILYKAMVLRARIEEIPATLKWHDAPAAQPGKPVRKSSMRIMRYLITLLVSGFLYRPIMLFLIPGATCLLVFALSLLWIGINWIQYGSFMGAWEALEAPFIVAAMSFVAAVQLLSCGMISLQNKCYFEQMFHLGTTTYRSSREGRKL